jgi:hypothetical protein
VVTWGNRDVKECLCCDADSGICNIQRKSNAYKGNRIGCSLPSGNDLSYRGKTAVFKHLKSKCESQRTSLAVCDEVFISTYMREDPDEWQIDHLMVSTQRLELLGYSAKVGFLC